jgi:hypothetical protein
MRKCRDINWFDISDVSMGVSVLQIYPAQPDKTGPQIIDTLTRRIMNLGEQTSISGVKLKIYGNSFGSSKIQVCGSGSDFFKGFIVEEPDPSGRIYCWI